MNVESKKSDVAVYFQKVKDTVEGTKNKLNKIVADMKREGNPNAAGVESEVNKFVRETLDKIIEGAETASEAIGDDNHPIGNVADQANNAGVGTAGEKIDNLVKGIKTIVEVVLKGEGKVDAGDDKKADGLAARANAGAGDARKLFGNEAIANDAKKVAADATKAVGAVTGADILQAISTGKEGESAKLASINVPIAVGNANDNNKKDATIAGGIVLRAMSKGGKFANANAADAADAKIATANAAISAVNKALNTLTVAIKKAVGVGLKEVKEAMKIGVNDKPLSSENSVSGSKE